MQSTLATLLLITSCVMLTCVVVEYAVASMNQTVTGGSQPQMDRIRDLESTLLNQTDSLFTYASTLGNATQQPQTTLPP